MNARGGGDDFAGFYADAVERVIAGLAVYCGDWDAAGDAAAEAFTRACERWGRVGRMERPEGWVYRVGVNVLGRPFRTVDSALRARDGPETPSRLRLPTAIVRIHASLEHRLHRAALTDEGAPLLEIPEQHDAHNPAAAAGANAALSHTARALAREAFEFDPLKREWIDSRSPRVRHRGDARSALATPTTQRWQERTATTAVGG